MSVRFSLIAALLLAGCSRGGQVAVHVDVPGAWAAAALREAAAGQARVDTANVALDQADVLFGRDLDVMLSRPAGELVDIGSAAAGRIASMVGRDGRWVGFSAVARVLVYDPEQVADAEAPTRLLQLAEPPLARRTVLADPRRGAATWTAAALASALGEARALTFYRDLVNGGGRLVDDDQAVLAALIDGTRPLALIDSDVAYAAQERQPRLVIVVPDQDDGGLGALLLPLAVALTKRGTDNAAAHALVETLLAPPSTLRWTMAENQVLVLNDTNVPAGMLRAGALRLLAVDYGALAERVPALRRALASIAP